MSGRFRRPARWLAPALALALGLGMALAGAPGRAALPPRYDFALRVASEGAISTLDPCRARSRAERDLVGQLFEGLVTRTATGYQPALALGWGVSADSLTWTFRLDPRRTFGDGTPVRAAHVVSSWQRAGREAPEWAWLFEGWNAQATDSLTLRVTLARPASDFLDRLDLPPAAVVREVTAGAARSLSGAGPFRFAGRGADGFVLAPRLDDPRGRPFAGRIFLKTVDNSGELRTLWQTGGAALADGAPFGGKAFDAATTERATPTAWLLVVNPDRPALKTPEGRERLRRALDRATLAGGLPGEGVTPLARLTDLFTAAAYGYGSDPSRVVPAAAAPVTLLADQNDRVGLSLAEDLVRPLHGAGLAATPKPLPLAACRQALKAGDYDLVVLRWDAPASRAGLAWPELLNRPEIVRLTGGAAAAGDWAAGLARLEAGHLLVPLVRRTDTLLARRDLVGVALDPLTGAVRLADVWPTVREQP